MGGDEGEEKEVWCSYSNYSIIVNNNRTRGIPNERGSSTGQRRTTTTTAAVALEGIHQTGVWEGGGG